MPRYVKNSSRSRWDSNLIPRLSDLLQCTWEKKGSLVSNVMCVTFQVQGWLVSVGDFSRALQKIGQPGERLCHASVELSECIIIDVYYGEGRHDCAFAWRSMHICENGHLTWRIISIYRLHAEDARRLKWMLRKTVKLNTMRTEKKNTEDHWLLKIIDCWRVLYVEWRWLIYTSLQCKAIWCVLRTVHVQTTGQLWASYPGGSQ